MKYIKTVLILLVALCFVSAQSVDIKDSSSHSLLTINDEGTAGSISLPTVGSTLTGTKLYNDGGNLFWGNHQLGTAGGTDGDWTIVGNNMYNNNSGNIGIGTTNPTWKFEVEWNPTINQSNPIALFNTSGATNSAAHIRIQNTSGNFYTFGMTRPFDNGDFAIAYNVNIGLSGDLLRITSAGNVGIGTTEPADKLHIFDGDLRFENNHGLKLMHATSNFSDIIANTDNLVISNFAAGDIHFRTHPTAGNASTRLIIKADGDIGIGTTSPEVKLQIYDLNNAVVKTVSENNSAFFVADGNQNSGLIMEENGIEKVAVYWNTAEARLSITESAEERLSIKNGDIDIYANEFNRSTKTSSANLVPIAYGVINSDGTIASGTGNFTCSYSAMRNRYEMVITDELYNSTDYTTIVTVIGAGYQFAYTDDYLFTLVVNILDNSSDSLVQNSFQFVTFKP